MADASVDARLGIIIDTDQASAQLRSLQAQISAFNKSVISSSAAAVAQQAAYNKALADGAVASRQFAARIVPVTDGVDRFTNSLERNKLSLGEYTRYAASQLPGMSRVFRREFETMTRVAETNVKRLNTQYVALGESAAGIQKALALTPTQLSQHGAQAAVAAQRQMLFNKMIDDGSTKLLNWGKNTQWAGRQLMVGFSIPLSMLGAVAAKTFMELDKGAIAFKRVYGNLETTTAEVEANLEAIQKLGQEYTKYGVKLSEVIELSASVAATGARNETLLAATEQTIRLATLGLMEYEEALQATIALQTAFGTTNEELASTIDFLNVVENETILTMQDMAAAIPRVAPVVKGLGGDVKDLAVFMTAMREGGISAEQGANALKSGLGRLINPTKAAREQMAQFGLSIDAIVQANKGDLMGIVEDFGRALSTLGEFEQQQILQKVFGTYQYARLGALFKNIANDASQAQRTIQLTGMSVEELAKISERELTKIEEATSTKFKAAIEELKIAIAPLGEAFLKAVTPIVGFITDLLEKFNNLPDGVKNAIALITGLVAGIGPVLLMGVGLIGNGVANLIKFVQVLRKSFARLKGDASAFEYLSVAEQEAQAAAASLEGQTTRLTSKLVLQQEAVETLTRLYQNLASSMASASGLMVGGVGGTTGAAPAAGSRVFVSGPQQRATASVRMNRGGLVPGTGNKDTVPAMLTPGESVVTKEATAKYPGIVSAMNSGTLRMFSRGAENINPLIAMGAGSVANRSHIIGLTPDTIGKTIAEGLKNPVVATSLADMIKKASVYGVRIDGNTLDLAERRVNVSRDPENLRIATAGFAGTSMFSPASRNAGFYESLPTAISGSAILQRDYLEQKKYAELAQRDMSLAPNVREGAIAFMKEAKELEAQGLLDKKQEVAFLKNRISLMAEQEIVDRGIKGEEAKILAAKKAQERMAQMEAAGIVKGGRIVDQAGVTQFLAGSAIAENPSVGAKKTSNISSTLLKNVAVQKLKDTSKFSFSDTVKSIFKRPRGNTLDALAMAGMPVPSAADLEKAGQIEQEAFNRGKQNAANAERNDSAMLTRSKRRNSPHPEMAQDGRDDQKAYDDARIAQAKADSAAIRAAILGQSGTPAGTGSVIPSSGKPIVVSSPLAIESREAVIARRVSEPYRVAAAAALAAAKADEAKIKSATAAAKADDMLANSFKRAASETLLSADQIKTSILTGETPNAPAGDQRRGRTGGIVAGLRGSADAFNRSMMGTSMGLMGLSMAASFAGGSIGELAQRVMPVAGGLMALQMILPMFTNPLGLATIAVTALVGGFIYLRKQLDDTARSAAEMGANIGGVANAMSIIEQATGFKAPTYQDNLFRFSEEDKKEIGEFSTFFDSEAGSKFIQDLKNATSEERYQKVSTLLAQGIASGLDQNKAEAFGKAIAAATGDALLASSIARDFANAVFESGSQALLDLERRRSALAPQIGASDIPTYTSGINNIGIQRFTAGNAQNPFQAAARTGGALMGGGAILSLAGAAVSGPLAPVVLGIGALGSLAAGVAGSVVGFVSAIEEQKVATSKAAKALGFSLQAVQNLANAEAVLEQERQNGIISYEEYIERQKELNRQQEEQSEYIKEIFSIGADAGALKQAFGNQLTLQGFTADQASIITENFNTDALSQRFFQKNFDELSAEQSDYVTQVFERVMTGLTPENAAQRLQDIEGTWTNIAQGVVDAMIKGAGEVNFDEAFMADSFTRWITSSLAGGLNQETMSFVPEVLASNLASMDQPLKELGSSAMQVQTILNGFADQELAVRILSNKNAIEDLGYTLNALKDFPNLNIEQTFSAIQQAVASKEFSTTADATLAIVSNIEKMSKIKFAKDGFFDDPNALLPNPETFTNIMLGMGKQISEIPGLYRSAFNKTDAILDEFGKNALTKVGSIRPTIMPRVIASVLGTTVTNASQISTVLNNAFPNELTPANITVLASLSGDPIALALLKDPNAVAAAKAGLSTYTQKSYQPGVGVVDVKRTLPTWFVDALSAFGRTTGDFGDTGLEDKPKGGGEKQKPWWQQLLDDSIANIKMFPRMINALKNKFNMPEQIIEMIGVGEEGLQKLQELLGIGQKKIRRLINTFNASVIATTRKDIQTEIAQEQAKKSAESVLLANNFSAEDAKELSSNLDYALAIVAARADKTGKSLKALLGDLRELLEVSRESKTPLEQLNDAWSNYSEAVETAFDVEERRTQKLFENRQYETASGKKNVEQIQEAIYANEKLIQVEQDKIDIKQEQINDYERETDLINQRIEDLRREDELRNRVADAISRELDVMGKKEESIRATYEDRIEALEKIASINDYLINQQRQQLDLTDAITRGDISAAARAMQDMQAADAQFASEQVRTGLQTAMQNEIDSLRTSEGLNRAEAEEKIAAIKEQSYQTSLKIRQEEDLIYYNNMQVRKLTNEIYDINEKMIEPLTNQNAAYQRILETHERDLQYAIDHLVAAGMTRDQWEAAKDQQQELIASITANMDKVREYRDLWNQAAAAAAKAGVASNAMSGPSAAESVGLTGAVASYDPAAGIMITRYTGGADRSYINPFTGQVEYYNKGGLINKFAAGGAAGSGTRDTVPAMLTPGEFVVRKSMVNKYGKGMLNAINQGAFTMPTYNTGKNISLEATPSSAGTTNIAAPVYNTYSVNVNVPNTNADPDLIANKVMMRISEIDSANIRRLRGN